MCLSHTCDFKQVQEAVQGVLCVLVTPVILNRVRDGKRVSTGCAVCLSHTCDFKQVQEAVQGVLCG